jgi:hypothetical protein
MKAKWGGLSTFLSVTQDVTDRISNKVGEEFYTDT